ncbi:MAG: protein translocase subunit SecF [Clostridia bacterium]
MKIIENRKKFYMASIIVICIGIISAIFTGFKLDIDFKGGTTIEANLGKTFDNNEIEKLVKETVKQEPLIQKVGTDQKSISITTNTISTEDMQKIVNKLKEKYPEMNEPTTKNIQPAFGKELISSALKAVGFSVLMILIYVAFRFRVMGFTAGLSAVLALVHDVLIMFTIYTVFKVPVNSVFVAAILTIIGYSINDTLIVYDRIRENKKKLAKADSAEVINSSIKDVFTRCVYTSVTTVACAIVLFIVALIYNQQVLQDFAFPLIIGLFSGTYSSIFVASPLWFDFENIANKMKNSKK